MGIVGNPNKNDFKGMVSNNMITNSPITTTAITNAQSIFGKDLASVRGKTMQWASVPIVGGRMFRFPDRSKEPYEWMDFVPKDALKYQGLLEDNEAPFPDISAELPGVPLEDEEYDF